jgi:hypothetical protein
MSSFIFEDARVRPVIQGSESHYPPRRQSAMMGSSQIQPFRLSSPVDPLRCRHLNKKFTKPNSEQIASEDVYGVDQRETRLNPHARIRFWVLPFKLFS